MSVLFVMASWSKIRKQNDWQEIKFSPGSTNAHTLLPCMQWMAIVAVSILLSVMAVIIVIVFFRFLNLSSTARWRKCQQNSNSYMWPEVKRPVTDKTYGWNIQNWLYQRNILPAAAKLNIFTEKGKFFSPNVRTQDGLIITTTTTVYKNIWDLCAHPFPPQKEVCEFGVSLKI